MSESSLPAPELPRATAARQFVSTTTAVEAFFDAYRRATGFDLADEARLSAAGAASV